MQSFDERIWYYLDANSNSQRGPVPSSVLLRLLEKGVSGVVGPTTLVWKEGMEKWLPMAEVRNSCCFNLFFRLSLSFFVQVDMFRNLLELHTKQWYYLDSENQTKGPIYTRLLLHKVQEGEIDGLTMIFGGGLTEWTKVSDVPELKEEIRKMGEEEEKAEAMQHSSIQISEEDQVFVSQPGTTSEQDAAVITHDPSKKEKKSFVSDEGERYKWDEEEQEWVADDDMEIEGEGDTENEGHRKDRKRSSVDAEMEEESDEEEHDTAGVKEESEKANEKPKRKRSKKKKKKGPNTWVYVSGLPANVTEEEMKDHFSKVFPFL
jgi:hypothetical protein